MPRLMSVATAVPRYALSQNEAQAAAREIFVGRVPHLERLLSVFMNAGIDRRYFVTPPAWFRASHPAEEVNRIFIETATELSAEAIRKALRRCSLQAKDIDYLVFTTTCSATKRRSASSSPPSSAGSLSSRMIARRAMSSHRRCLVTAWERQSWRGLASQETDWTSWLRGQGFSPTP